MKDGIKTQPSLKSQHDECEEFLLEELGLEGWLEACRGRAFWVEGAGVEGREQEGGGVVWGAAGGLHTNAHLGLGCHA